MSKRNYKNKVKDDTMNFSVSYHEQPVYGVNNLLKDMFDVVFGFNWDMSFRPFKVLSFIVVRVFIYFLLNKYYDSYFSNIIDMISGNLIGDLLFVLFCIYGLFHVFSTIVMSIYVYRFGQWNHDTSLSETDEIEKLISWRDNKMKFMTYPESMKLMQDTAMLNNLKENSQYAESKNVLNYMNNKIRFMSYPDAVKFIKGKK